MINTSTTLSALALSLGLSACVITTDGDSSFTIENRSDYAIYEVYLAERNQSSWGPDLLHGTTLFPGENLEVYSIECGTYDALIYDQFGGNCELNSIDLCFDDAYWTITNATLATCAIFQ